MFKNSIVLSVKTHWADLIMSGVKTLELRTRSLPKDRNVAIIYSSGLDKALVGYCKYHEVSYLEEDVILSKACLTKQQYDSYSKGKPVYQYDLTDPVKFKEPYELSHFGLSHAPHSWVYTYFLPATLFGSVS